ncbi:MAG: hypothetical protein HY314_11320 [Acidobacteria bacterium]|nr:hypothetical protein [Acidobacteriota bacterium]
MRDRTLLDGRSQRDYSAAIQPLYCEAMSDLGAVSGKPSPISDQGNFPTFTSCVTAVGERRLFFTQYSQHPIVASNIETG